MQLNDFDYDLPPELIASHPQKHRENSKLLVYQQENIIHQNFNHIVDVLQPNDVLVLNNTKVMPARLFGRKDTGGKIEFLVERLLDNKTALVHVKTNRKLAIGAKVEFSCDYAIELIEQRENLFVFILVNGDNWQNLMTELGHTPLPPYIKRSAKDIDIDRYQTVYSQKLGAVAAHTAGLHFSHNLLSKIQNKGVKVVYITLHIGAGTFKPVKTNDIKEHKMHSEWLSVSDEVVSIINTAKSKKHRIFAVGTTVARSLETVAKLNSFNKGYQGDTDIFIYPGFKFEIIDALITNFHLPKSTLLMLVAAFVGQQSAKYIYQEAIEQRYRFFSYGDASLLFKADI